MEVGGRIAGLALAALCAATGCGGGPPEADLVLRGGRIVTLDEALPEAQALAIVGGRIAAVGDAGEIAAWIGPATEVMDLDGGLVVPGFIESHGHLEKLGRVRDNLDLSQVGSWEEIVATVRLAVEKAGPDRARGAVCASDAFYPFPDALDVCAAAGVTAFVQPGGSQRDSDVVSAADATGAAMLMTGVRHFRH